MNHKKVDNHTKNWFTYMGWFYTLHEEVMTQELLCPCYDTGGIDDEGK